ncbi:MAG: hypothetical protein RIB46_19925 [Pseudomonadales bacterium]
MNQQQFEALLDRLGSDLNTWPEADARAARDLLASSADAAAALAAASAVARHLEGRRQHRAPHGLAARIVAAAATPRGRLGSPLERLLEQLLNPPWRPALLALLPLALGFVIGLQQADPADQTLPDELLTLAFDDGLYRSDLYLELNDEQP